MGTSVTIFIDRPVTCQIIMYTISITNKMGIRLCNPFQNTQTNQGLDIFYDRRQPSLSIIGVL
jgi:hypothetical protein